MRQHFVWLLVLALMAPLAAHAQELEECGPGGGDGDAVATPAEQLGASVSVVNGQDFQTYHYPTVDEALRNVPGVEIRRSGSYGKTSSISIRGANANQVQVLVDGLRVKSPTLGQVDLSDISPDLIERIEVIRGAQSTLYGADAIGGVVNIITRKGTGGPFQATVQQEDRQLRHPTPRGPRSAAPTRSSTTRCPARTSRATASSRTTARTPTHQRARRARLAALGLARSTSSSAGTRTTSACP